MLRNEGTGSVSRVEPASVEDGFAECVVVDAGRGFKARLLDPVVRRRLLQRIDKPGFETSFDIRRKYTYGCEVMYVPISLLVIAAVAAVDEIEERVVHSRLAIHSGYLQVETIDYDIPQEGNAQVAAKRVLVYDIWFDGDKVRTTTSAGEMGASGGSAFFAKEDSLRSDGKIFRRDFVVNSPDMIVHMPFAVEDDPQSWLDFQKYVVDPRLMGLQPVPFTILHSCGLREFVANPIRESTGRESIVYEGSDAILITYEGSGATARMWVAPDKGWNLYRAEIERTNGRKYSLVNQLGQFADVWFPTECVYELYTRDGGLQQRNVTKVVEASLNHPIPPERFELADLGLAEGTMLFPANRPGSPVGVWDGEKLASLREANVGGRARRGPPSSPPIGTSSSLRWLFIGNLVVGALILIALVVYRTRKQK